jgi:hypothetical protein
MAVSLWALRVGRSFTPQKHCFCTSGTHLCQRLNKPQSLVGLEVFGKLTTFIHRIGSWTHDLSDCSVMYNYISTPKMSAILMWVDRFTARLVYLRTVILHCTLHGRLSGLRGPFGRNRNRGGSYPCLHKNPEPSALHSVARSQYRLSSLTPIYTPVYKS